MESYIGKVYTGTTSSTRGHYYVFQETDETVEVLEVTERVARIKTYRKAAINSPFFALSNLHIMKTECKDTLGTFLTILKHLSLS